MRPMPASAGLASKVYVSPAYRVSRPQILSVVGIHKSVDSIRKSTGAFLHPAHIHGGCRAVDFLKTAAEQEDRQAPHNPSTQSRCSTGN